MVPVPGGGGRCGPCRGVARRAARFPPPLKDRVPKNVRLHGDACRVISPGAISPEADYPVFIRNTRVSRSLLTVMIVSEVLGYYTAEIRRIIEHEGMERP